MFQQKLEEIEILRDNNQSMISQISENVRMEEKLRVQGEIINKLQDELREKYEFQNQQEELQKLVDDIKQLEDINEEKEAQLADIAKENEELKVKLASIETEEELSLERKPQNKFPCELCGKGFDIKNDLKIHFEMNHKKQIELRRLNEKFVSLETRVLEQKYNLMSSLSNLQEKRHQEKTCLPVCWYLQNQPQYL